MHINKTTHNTEHDQTEIIFTQNIMFGLCNSWKEESFILISITLIRHSFLLKLFSGLPIVVPDILGRI